MNTPSAPAPLKILHFTTTVGGGGAETMLCNVVEEHRARGIESVVVTTSDKEGHRSTKERIERSAKFYNLNVPSLLDPKMASGLWKILREEKPDVVQTWMHTSGIVAGMISHFAGVHKVVWGIHSRDLLCDHAQPCWRCNLLAKSLGLTARILPSRIVSCSQDGLQNHCRTMGYPANKMVWIANGIDINRFQPSPELRAEGRLRLGIPESAPVVGMVTRMNPVKDVPTFLRAAALLQKSRPDAHAVIFGETLEDASDEIRELSAALDPERMHWAGYHHKAETLYPVLDILTVTSVSEAFPMVLIEAMSCGVPCVSTEVGDARVIVANTGGIVPLRDPDAVAEAWEAIFRMEPEARERLTRRTRELSVQRFGLEHCAAQYMQIYEQLAA